MSTNFYFPNYLSLPKLLPLTPLSFAWNGDCGILPHWLRRFRKYFSNYDDLSAISFLRTCVPTQYYKDIDGQYTLAGALHELSQWASDMSIHTEKIEVTLRGLNKSTSLEGDKFTLRKQITHVTCTLEISEDYYMNIAQCCTHLAKYHDPTAYMIMHQQLKDVTIANHDPQGRRNYVVPFLHSLKVQLRSMDNKFLVNS